MKLFSNLSQIFSLSWRVAVVALGYTVTLVLAGVILGVLGLLAAASLLAAPIAVQPAPRLRQA